MKNRIVQFMALFVCVLLPLSSCKKNNSSTPADPVPINLNNVQKSLVTAGNSFAFDVFSRISSAAGNQNTIISPLSLSYALSMTVNGAAGSTRDSILKALRVGDITVDDLNRAFKELTDALLSVDEKVIIDIANSVWAEKDFAVKQAFSDILSGFYYAEARSFDITDPTAPEEINQWISDHTNGLIKNMIDHLEDNTVMLLVNAIYFKGKWKVEFDKSVTTNRIFTKPDASAAEVATMHQTEEHKVYLGDGFGLLELPYGQGNFVIDILLPDNNDLATLAANLNETNFAEWTSSATTRKVNIYLPKFKYGFKQNMNDILATMGMAVAFTDNADFSNISDIPLLINKVLHQAFIETNEEGTEAAAATVVDVGVTSVGPDNPVLFDVNHQFLYIIREVSTNSVIFMGKVTDPTAQ